MSDQAHDETEAILKALEKRITKEYRQAERELQTKLDDYLKRFETKDKIWQNWVKEGVKTEQQYKDWRVGQMAIGRRWEAQKESIAQDLSHVNQIARNIVSEKMPDVYALNHNFGTYEVEKGSGIDTGYTLYDRDTVEGLFKDRKIYHDPGRNTASKIAQGLENRWNRQNVQSVMLQGILQGESIPKIATRLSETVGEKNRKAAIRNARTITTGVENKGRVDSYNRANEMGIETQKQWIATLDGRTRHSHRELDGETVGANDVFSNGCEYPGDPHGDPAEIYNCRCSLIASIKGFERDASDLSLRNTNKLEDMTYDEWKAEKESESNPITLPEEKAENIKGSYIGEYKGNINKNSQNNGKMRMDLQFFGEKALKEQSDKALLKGIKRHETLIEEHKGYIANPEQKYGDLWDTFEETRKNREIGHWTSEIETFKRNIKNREDELRRRGKL